MAAAVRLYGVTTVSICLANGGTLATLGYSINGVEIEETVYNEDVHGDQKGGDAGPPIEVVMHGEVHKIRISMSKWDDSVADVIRKNVSGGTAGVPPTAGTLLFGGNNAIRVLLNNAGYPRNYPIVEFIKEPRSFAMGSRASTLVIAGTAYVNGSGVLWDQSTTSTYSYVAPG